MLAPVLLALALHAQTVAGSAAQPRSAAQQPRAAAQQSAARVEQRPRRRLVVVDAGHGGPDAGMHGPIGRRTTLYEKDITLAVAKRLARELESRGVSVLMTRTTDTLIALGDRGKIANAAKGDLFISIHVNAANPNWKDPGAARGFETYFLAEAKTEDERRVAQMENEVVRFERNADPADESGLGFILKDMAQNEQLRESSDLAATIQSHLRRIHPGPSRGVKQAGFMVLVTAFMPSVLVEIGFGTNPAEAAYISGDSGQRAIAGAVADAAMEYLAHYERRVSGVESTQEQPE
ncbi:MAG: N-acetylmuramoyl-L-alanine amidase [Gemmatimonadales bacterium]